MRWVEGASRTSVCGLCAVASWCAIVAASARAAEVPKLPRSTVGLPARVEQLVLQGTELEAAPWDDATPVVVRIEAVYPHGTAMRYDISYQGLEPGEYDLRAYLRRKDGSTTDDLPALEVKIETLLPPGQIRPNDLASGPLPRLGGYRLLLAAAGIVWLAVLIWLLYPRRKRAGETSGAEASLSLADRLRPLVADATAGRLPPEKLAELERALVGYWRRRLGMDDLPPAVALEKLRSHPEASPLVRQLETWLHRPAGAGEVDINALLSPYRDLPADELDRVPVAAEAHSR
ncbi:MAG: hypothetical protein HYX69_03510 [Planctomycetia bacterium]|nr:hypothetical protein [Planctomycetia bacterium]